LLAAFEGPSRRLRISNALCDKTLTLHNKAAGWPIKHVS